MKNKFRRNLEEILLTLTVSLAFSACANRTMSTSDETVKTPAMQKEVSIAERQGAEVVSRVQFEKGSAALTPEARQELNTAIEQARTMGKVKDVTVAVWSDSEMPARGEKVSKQQVELASDRADEIENYIDDRFDIDNVKVHNMSREPNALAKVFSTADARFKEQLRREGVAPDTKDGTAQARASSALIMVDVE